MNYSRPELRSALAAQYALGTLRGSARRRFERLLPADPQLRAQLRWWDERLARLALRLQPRAPRETVWLDLERRAFREPARIGARGAPDSSARSSRKPAVAPWQGLGWIALAASIVLATTLFLVPQAPQTETVAQSAGRASPAYVAELWPKDQPSGWTIDVRPDQGGMKVKTRKAYPADPQHDVELWVIAGGKPVSVGLMPRSGDSWLNWPKSVPFAEKLLLAVSYEPAGGSPTGSPTGPVLATGEIRRGG